MANDTLIHRFAVRMRRRERPCDGVYAAGLLVALHVLPLGGCGGTDDEVVAGGDPGPFIAGDAPVQLPVFAGCESEFHGSCDVLDSECQNRVFSTARCLRHQPDAVLPVVRVISKEQLLSEVASEDAESTETTETSETPGEDEPEDETADATKDRALELLGLTEPDELSDESYEQVFVNTVPAYYSSESDVVTLIDDELGDAPTKTLSLLHELVHALQDQDSSLVALNVGEETTFDAYLAALSMVEGEAEMLESFVAAASWGFEQDPNYRKFYTSWVPNAEEAYAEQSPLLVSPRYFPYSYGARFVFDVFASEGIAGVRARFQAPPVSVLPMMLNQLGPVTIELESMNELQEPSAPLGFRRHAPDSLGPWIVGKFLERVVPDVLDLDLPSHWRGDRLLTWSSDDRGIAAVWTVRFDTQGASNGLFGRARTLALAGVPSANAFCIQSGQDVTFGVTENASSRDLWSAAVLAAPTGSPAASAATPSELPAATPPTPAATPQIPAPPSAAAPRRQLRRAWRDRLARLARRPR